MADRRAGHEIAITIEARYGVSAEIVCHEPPGARCRRHCECSRARQEGWTGEIHEHQWVLVGRCLAAEWIQESGPTDMYAGDPTPLQSGPIAVEWDGDDWVWRYIDGACVMTARCELTELLVSECAHCRRVELPTGDGRTFEARHGGYCPACDEPIRPGDRIRRTDGRYVHAGWCP